MSERRTKAKDKVDFRFVLMTQLLNIGDAFSSGSVVASVNSVNVLEAMLKPYRGVTTAYAEAVTTAKASLDEQLRENGDADSGDREGLQARSRLELAFVLEKLEALMVVMATGGFLTDEYVDVEMQDEPGEGDVVG